MDLGLDLEDFKEQDGQLEADIRRLAIDRLLLRKRYCKLQANKWAQLYELAKKIAAIPGVDLKKWFVPLCTQGRLCLGYSPDGDRLTVWINLFNGNLVCHGSEEQAAMLSPVLFDAQTYLNKVWSEYDELRGCALVEINGKPVLAHVIEVARA